MFPEDLGHRLGKISAAAREYLLARAPDCFVDEGLREKCLRLFTPPEPAQADVWVRDEGPAGEPRRDPAPLA